MTDPNAWKCGKCFVTFRIKKGSKNAPRDRCPSPGCGRRFWHTDGANGIRMGMDEHPIREK